MIIPVLLALTTALSACGDRKSDSADFTPPLDYDATKGCKRGEPCIQNGRGQMRIEVSATVCPATISVEAAGPSYPNRPKYNATSTSYSKYFSATSGDVFAVAAGSTCNSSPVNIVTVSIYKDGTKVAGDTKAGISIAVASANY